MRVRTALVLAISTYLASWPMGRAQSPPSSVQAQSTEVELEQLRARISALTEQMNRTRASRDATAARLREIELGLGRLATESRSLQARLVAGSERMALLGADRDDMGRIIDAQLAHLSRDVRSAHAIGRQDRLKLVLNQENPTTLSRALTYYAYFNRARAKRIERLRLDLVRLKEIEAGLSRERAGLERLEHEQQSAIAALEVQREERRQLLAKLGNHLSRQETRLARLRDDERALAELLASLSRELADIPLKLEEDRPFSAERGRLPWPAPGRVRHRFGTPRGEGDLTWQGVVIAAPAGTPVKAVSRGRVAFADWLRGFGLLLILDHGDGYMSLYGYNQTLLKDVGDWVSTGERIAHVGDSGGRRDVGLYFEIRHRGTPRNPAPWMTSKGMPAQG